MTSVEELETGTALELKQKEENPNPGDYELARLHVAELLEDVTGDKIKAMDILARLEAALWGTALLFEKSGAEARKAFGVGYTEFCKDLD